MGETGTTTKAITLHRLCLIVPLAIQLSFPVVLIEITIVEQIRRDGPLTVGGYYGAFYFLTVLLSLFWLPWYVSRNQVRLGSAAKYWNAYLVMIIFLLLLGFAFPAL
ncbi:MAG: hypothetical protein B9S32_12150 [Verrucomicrobia bacterium Tous-C9LFEB]|nr:MAG: hypothetical protein B9S32_12150 [Verrucomicrobia bacterium Tous-C9LFEB]